MTFRAIPSEELTTLRRQLRRYAVSRLCDPDAAEDVVQETFVAAMGQSAPFEGRSKLRTWLTAILLHKIADHLRATVKKRAVIQSEVDRKDPADADDEGASSYPVEPVDFLSDPSRVVDARQTLEAVSRQLARLPRRNARAYVMSDLEGFETREVCDELGVTPTNLWVVLHRTRKALRAGMAA